MTVVARAGTSSACAACSADAAASSPSDSLHSLVRLHTVTRHQLLHLPKYL